MNILDLVAQYLESIGYVHNPYNPGCFFYVSNQGVNFEICLYRNDGRSVNIQRTKEPTVVLVYQAIYARSKLVDLTDPESLKDIGILINE